MQRGGAPCGVEQGPAEVNDGPVAERAVQLDRAVGGVGHKAGDRASGEQLHGPCSSGTRSEQPREQREHQHVAERVGDRHGLLQPGQRLVVDVGPDQEGPRHQPEAGGKGQRVDQAAQVAVRGAPVDEHQQPGRVQRVAGQVEHVRVRREGQRHLELLGDQETQLARREAGEPRGEQDPRRLPGGPVDYQARHDRGDPAEADQRPGRDPQAVKRVVNPDEQCHPDGVAAENIPLVLHGDPPVLAGFRRNYRPLIKALYPAIATLLPAGMCNFVVKLGN